MSLKCLLSCRSQSLGLIRMTEELIRNANFQWSQTCQSRNFGVGVGPAICFNTLS